jgi:hypothetical protein
MIRDGSFHRWRDAQRSEFGRRTSNRGTDEVYLLITPQATLGPPLSPDFASPVVP